MGNYLIGKCYRIHDEEANSLVCIERSIDVDWYYRCKRLIKPTKGIGYFSDTDILNISCKDLIEVDPIIWSKIYKILKMNTISCDTIIQNYKEYESSTGYYLSTFSTKIRHKLFELLKDSQVLVKFSDSQVRIVELKDDAVKFETMFSTGKKWISPETYNRVKNNVKNTIEEIDNIWETI